MNYEVHKARKQDIPCLYARANVAGAKNGSLVTIKNGDLVIKVPVFCLPDMEDVDTEGSILLPKVFRMALNVKVEDTVEVASVN